MLKFKYYRIIALGLGVLALSCSSQKEDTDKASSKDTTRAEVKAPLDKLLPYLDTQGEMLYLLDAEQLINQMLAGLGRMLQSEWLKSESGLPPEIISSISVHDLAKEWGVSSIKAYGASSLALDDGRYRNKTALYLPGGLNKGVWGMGLSEVPMHDGLKLITAGVDVVMSSSLDLRVLHETVYQSAERIAGSMGTGAIDSFLDQPTPLGMTWKDIIDQLHGRITVGLKLPTNQSDEALEDSFEEWIPELILVVQGSPELMSIIEAALALMGANEQPKREVNGLLLHALPSAGLPLGESAPFWLMDESKSYFVLGNNDGLLDRLAERGPSIIDDSEYKRAMQGLGGEGYSAVYLSTRAFDFMESMKTKLVQSNPEMQLILQLYGIFYPILLVENQTEPSAILYTAESDMLLSSANWPTADYQGSLAGGQESVMVAGLVAAMAIPAFQKVRADSRKAALINDARQIAASAMQHFLMTNEEEVAIIYDSETGQVSGPLSEFIRMLGRGYTIQETIYIDKPFTISHPEATPPYPGASKGDLFYFSFEGRLLEWGDF